MADRIKLLPEFVANQIAAGEVVNRPSSVVKEMMENAVDAGARNITVNFRDGGKSLIQIVDDGIGMSPIDARLAFDRHATSKIDSVDDIYRLETFGFRGEALASIASVAEVELRTRQKGQELGTVVGINGGKFVCQNTVSCPEGSQFLVKNLFYNVPARRRFLDKSSTESRHIMTEYQRVVLCNPDIGFSIYDSDALISRLPASGLRQRVIGVAGKNMARNLLDVNADTSIVKIEGFAGRPSSAKQSNKEQFLFVNGRFFKSPYLHKAVVSAYEKLIPANAQPSYFLYFTIDPSKIDVNVHPQKTEIKFEDGADIWQIVNAAVRESLAKSGAVPAMDFDMDTSVEIPVFRSGVSYKMPEIKGNPDFNPFRRDDHVPAGRSSKADLSDFVQGYESFASDNISQAEEADYSSSLIEYIGGDNKQPDLELCRESQFVGAVHIGAKYLATAMDGNLVIVDVRRAFEAVLYGRYRAMLDNGSSVSQQLLFPEKVAFSTDDISLLREHLTDFSAFGFDIRISGEHAVEIYGLPADFISLAPEELIYDILDVLRDESGNAEEVRKHRLASAMARMGASSKPRTMGGEEADALLQSLAECTDPSYTPSGNPVMTVITEEQIGKMLKKG